MEHNRRSRWPVSVAAAAVAMTAVACQPSPGGRTDSVLWYRQPAAHWVEALPLGNGRLGAMVFGRTLDERIALNEQTLWTGGPLFD